MSRVKPRFFCFRLDPSKNLCFTLLIIGSGLVGKPSAFFSISNFPGNVQTMHPKRDICEIEFCFRDNNYFGAAGRFAFFPAFFRPQLRLKMNAKYFFDNRSFWTRFLPYILFYPARCAKALVLSCIRHTNVRV